MCLAILSFNPSTSLSVCEYLFNKPADKIFNLSVSATSVCDNNILDKLPVEISIPIFLNSTNIFLDLHRRLYLIK